MHRIFTPKSTVFINYYINIYIHIYSIYLFFILYNIFKSLCIKNNNNILQTVTVEPGITMGQLIPILIQCEWTLPVVLDLNDITIGK